MTKLWGWMQANAGALQGSGALVLLIGAGYAAVSVLLGWIQPDILVRVNIDRDTVPAVFKEWMRDTSRVMIQLKDVQHRPDWIKGKLGKR